MRSPLRHGFRVSQRRGILLRCQGLPWLAKGLKLRVAFSIFGLAKADSTSKTFSGRPLRLTGPTTPAMQTWRHTFASRRDDESKAESHSGINRQKGWRMGRQAASISYPYICIYVIYVVSPRPNGSSILQHRSSREWQDWFLLAASGNQST